jgi:hypothetical protein
MFILSPRNYCDATRKIKRNILLYECDYTYDSIMEVHMNMLHVTKNAKRTYVHTMESFKQLNIHNQNVIKFGLFKIQTLK